MKKKIWLLGVVLLLFMGFCQLCLAAERTISREELLENGGQMEMRDDETTYIINCDF